tara:strand:+ start:598 stop:732 length:135 start_codon:yes stop_codon:yes gene_type:complete
MQDEMEQKTEENCGEFGSFRTEVTLVPGPGCWGRGANPQKTRKN